MYADLDAFISPGDQQGEVSNEETDAFIRDFLAGPSSVGLDMTESTADAVIETEAEAAVSSTEPLQAADQEEQSLVGETAPVDVGSNEADLSAAVEVVEYEVEEPITEGRRTVVRAHV